MNGNTATYMQYAYARVLSIFARGGVDVSALRADALAGLGAIDLTHPAERGLVWRYCSFPSAGADRGRIPAQLFDLLFVRSGQPVLDVLRAVPRVESRGRRDATQPAATVRSGRAHASPGARIARHSGRRQDVAGRGGKCVADPKRAAAGAGQALTDSVS